MYLFLGGETLVQSDALIGIFDLDSTTLSAATRNFLAQAEGERRVTNTSPELPKSFALEAKPKRRKNPNKIGDKLAENSRVYICQPNTATLKKRLELHQFGT